MLSAGELNQRIKIYAQVTQRGNYGEEVERYKLLGTTSAGVKHLKGMQAIALNEEYNANTIAIKIRYSSKITDTCKIVYNGREYVIESFNADKIAGRIDITARYTRTLESERELNLIPFVLEGGIWHNDGIWISTRKIELDRWLLANGQWNIQGQWEDKRRWYEKKI